MLHQELTNMGFKIYLISNNNILRLKSLVKNLLMRLYSECPETIKAWF